MKVSACWMTLRRASMSLVLPEGLKGGGELWKVETWLLWGWKVRVLPINKFGKFRY